MKVNVFAWEQFSGISKCKSSQKSMQNYVICLLIVSMIKIIICMFFS